MTKTNVEDMSHGSILSSVDWQERHDSWMGRMFHMVELHLLISGFPLTNVEMEELVERYLLRDSPMYMCRMGLTFQEPLHNDEAKVDDELDEDDTSLMAINRASDVAGGRDGGDRGEENKCNGKAPTAKALVRRTGSALHHQAVNY
ncbi:hypothetical protein H5410_046161 [Solanum commersonii]|uniref:Uncharacterized protein n=1 Tax=Solanum commersonii TaxID=4109 RepID=A0A9J5XDP6_SOLCO|nr:hypothetical protein H5410_046161 [Solanum commersonii]